MNIIWQYLNKKAAALDALKDYGSMKFIIDHTDDEIKDIHSDMEAPGRPAFDGITRTHNPKSNEEHLIKNIDEIDVLKERYRQALEYMAWFQPAWENLTEDERYVLKAFYLSNGTDEPVGTVCEHFSIERSSAYNKKNRALKHLALLLYGKQ